MRHSVGSGDEGQSRNKNFVPGCYPCNVQRNMKCSGAINHCHRVSSARKFGQF